MLHTFVLFRAREHLALPSKERIEPRETPFEPCKARIVIEMCDTFEQSICFQKKHIRRSTMWFLKEIRKLMCKNIELIFRIASNLTFYWKRSIFHFLKREEYLNLIFFFLSLNSFDSNRLERIQFCANFFQNLQFTKH